MNVSSVTLMQILLREKGWFKEKIPSEIEVTPRYKLLLSKILGDLVTEWMDGVDTPLTVMTTRAPAVLKTQHYAFCFFQYFVFRTKPRIHTLRESICLLNFRVNVRRIVWRLQIWFNVMNEKLITSTLTHFFLCLHHLILPADPAKPIQKAALWKIFDIFKKFFLFSSVHTYMNIFTLFVGGMFQKKRKPEVRYDNSIKQA